MALGIAIVSGGMDSVVLAHMLAEQGDDLHLLSFNYGQRHKKELEFARIAAADLGARHSVVDLTTIGSFLSGSALTDDIAVPDGHYAEQTMRQTVVPNRNAIMLSIATGIAIAEGAKYVATGVHSGDHYIYPDCRPGFIDAMSGAMMLATDGFAVEGFEGIRAPFVNMTKGGICRTGSLLEVPVDHTRTWSCYKGGEIHCGSCGTCFERREAFEEAGVDDPTEYLNTPHYDDPRQQQ
jgi:7-cyano-7-deazaguanine synthase